MTDSSSIAPLYAITRRRYDWVVRLVRNGERFEKCFRDRVCGGKAEALVRATDWRDRIIHEHPPRARREKAMRRRINSGPVPGVTADTDDDGKIVRWRAKTYVSKEQILQKTFSVAIYGRAARRRAIEERARQLQFLDGLVRVHPEEEKLRQAVPVKQSVGLTVAPNRLIRVTNSSGFPGVVRRGRYWTAQTTAGSAWVSQSFRVDVYGEEVALVLAVWARLDQLSADVPPA